MYITIGVWISYTPSVEREVGWITSKTLPFCSRNSGSILITSWSREKIYQALHVCTFHVPESLGTKLRYTFHACHCHPFSECIVLKWNGGLCTGMEWRLHWNGMEACHFIIEFILLLLQLWEVYNERRCVRTYLGRFCWHPPGLNILMVDHDLFSFFLLSSPSHTYTHMYRSWQSCTWC